MKTYLVERWHHSYGCWRIQANSDEEAEKIWAEMLENGDVDFSGMDVYEVSEAISEEE